jgi:plastocyanin
MKFLKSLAATALVIAASCGGDGGTSYGGTTGPTGGTTGGTQTGGSNPVQTNAVGVGDDFYNPANIQVSVGTTVTWTWAATAATHNVTFADGVASGDKGAGANYTRTFSTAGTYNYHCTLHSVMTGSVIVQ